MTVADRPQAARDILAAPWRTALLYGLPSLVIMATGVSIRSPMLTFGVADPWRGAIWAAAMSVMAGACLVNALRCGRTHCYVTGPFFILTALASLAYGLGWLPLGPSGWSLIGLVTLVGAVLLTWLPDAALGKYRTRAAAG